MLEAGEWQAELRPEIGGALSALRYCGNDVLRPMEAGSNEPTQAACFPLVPFCNRIRQARFTYYEREIHLTPNHQREPHALHGYGWHQPWQLDVKSASKAVLIHANDGSDEWPWAYSAEQVLTLTEDGLRHELTVTNLANVPAPMGLGLHPYFRRRPGTKVHFRAGAAVMTGDDNIPTGVFEDAARFADWPVGTYLPEQLVDHTHLDWNGTATITDDLGTITLRAEGAPHLHIYAPTDGTTLCCEPVTHMADALNQDPAGMIVLPPGASAQIMMQIGAE